MPAFSLYILELGLIKLAKYPMFSAVYSLSPVIIITTTPAASNLSIVYGTSSWRRSSIAVDPSNISSLSKSYTNLFSLFSIVNFVYDFIVFMLLICVRYFYNKLYSAS